MAIVRKDYMKIGNHKWRYWITEKRLWLQPETRVYCTVCKRIPDTRGIDKCIPFSVKDGE